MDAVKDFLLEYYIWVLAVLVILLITVIGFLADTKKKKKNREKMAKNTTKEIDNTSSVGGDVEMNQNGMMNQGMDVNANNGYATGNEMNNSMDNNLNTGGSESYFVPASSQTPNIEPMDIANQMPSGNAMTPDNGLAMEPTAPTSFPVPSDNTVNQMPYNGVVNNMMNNTVPNVQEPVFSSSVNTVDNMMPNAMGPSPAIMDNVMPPVLEQNSPQGNMMPNNMNLNPMANTMPPVNNMNMAPNMMNSNPMPANPIPMPEMGPSPANVMPNMNEPVSTVPIMNSNMVGQPMNPGMGQNPNMMNGQPNQFNNGQFNSF